MEKSSLRINTSTDNFILDTGCIIRIEASSSYSKIFFSDGKVLVTAKVLKWFEERLPRQSFTRMHRSHLINKNYLHLHQQFGKTVALQNGNIIPVSRRRKKMVWQKLVAAGLLLFLCCPAFAQNVGIGTNTPHTSAALDVVSNSKGMSIPSLTTAQRTAIASPKAGLFVFDTNLQTLCMFNGANWVYFQSSAEPNEVLPTEQVALDGEVGDFFGNSVAIDGNYAVVGAENDNIGNNVKQGSAYIFFFNGTAWVQQAKLTAADGNDNDNFGHSVSISGDYVVVGTENDDVGINVNQGSAYVFFRSGVNWTQQAKIIATGGSTNDFFGNSVSISGSYIVAGSRGDDVGANTNEGSAYFFVRSGVSWAQQDQVVAPLGAANDQFGYSVSISGDYAVVGAPYDDIAPNSDNGTIHIFLRSGTNWSHQQTYSIPVGGEYNLGYKVSISGDIIVAGYPKFNNPPSGVTFLRRNGVLWDQYDGIVGLNPEVQEFSFWGIGAYGLATFGNYTIIGSAVSTYQGVAKGVAYLYQTPSPVGTGIWFFVRKIADPLGQINYYAGYSVAVSNSYCIVGAPGSNGSKGKVLFLKL
jgi:FG-GAP repeat/LytTr DNA-binding domain